MAAPQSRATRPGQRGKRAGETRPLRSGGHLLPARRLHPYDAMSAPIQREEPLTSPAGIVLSVVSLVIMPVLAHAKHRTGREMGSRALVADSKETESVPIYRSRCSLAWARSPCSDGGGPTQLVDWRYSLSSCGKGGRRLPKHGSQSRPSKTSGASAAAVIAQHRGRSSLPAG